jgi:hypothetical protein
MKPELEQPNLMTLARFRGHLDTAHAMWYIPADVDRSEGFPASTAIFCLIFGNLGSIIIRAGSV